MPDTVPIPRLSELPGKRSPAHCQRCGAYSLDQLLRWQEHDDGDRPQPIVVVLCVPCSNRVIEPHPRLYRQLRPREPFPAAMPVCLGCAHRDGLTCRSPLSRANGGPGLRFPGPDSRMHVYYGGGRGRWLESWSKWPETCEGFEAAPGVSSPESGDSPS